MVDSRGATVISRIHGTKATISTPSFYGMAFLMGLTGAPIGLPRVGVTGSGLNSGVTIMDDKNEEVGNNGW